jgi:2-polyprenyl-3-methyl-5-hydroxy-6-metoxy-1,4-benzoquinol methylase
MPAFCLNQRRREPEWMDQPGLDCTLHDQALAALRRINRLSLTGRRLGRRIVQLARTLGRPLRVLDLASGGGDVALALASEARRKKTPLEVVGCDVSATAVRYSESQAQRAGFDNVRFFQLDVLQQPLPAGYDVVTCSLFLHHLDEGDGVRLLRTMAASAKHLVLLDDLCRSPAGRALVWLGCRLLTRSPVVHVDGPRSIQAAFTVEEAAELARQAGLTGCQIVRHWPQRFLLSWSRT